LSMREHSRVELARKLAPYVDESDDMDSLLDFLEAAKFLSTLRFSESLVNRRQERFGNQRILSELRSHGLADEQLADIKSNLIESELHRASDVLRRKYPELASNHQERARQMRFLQQRGFSNDTIYRAMRLVQQRDAEANDTFEE
jgi:regulatory protein